MIFAGTPFNITDAVAEERISSIHLIHLSPKPYILSIIKMAEHSTLSNASKSILTIFLFDL
jgi:hypothetical protein